MSDAIKRGVDLLLSAAAICVSAPLWPLISLAILLESGRPVLYRARRLGLDGEIFTMHKFRTMRHRPDVAGPAITAGGDVRVTRVGKFLRKSKLDELPQLYDVLMGSMSLVGPRPEDPKFLSKYSHEARKVLSVRPGITGPTAIAFRHEEQLLAAAADPEKEYVERVLPWKLQMDLAYVESHSLGLDLSILLRTFLAIVARGSDDQILALATTHHQGAGTLELEMRELNSDHLQEITQVHLAAFHDSALSALGKDIVRRYYEWQLTGGHDVVALGVFEGSRLLAFAMGGLFTGSLSGFLERNRRALIVRVVTRPWLLLRARVRQRLMTVWRLWRGGPVAAKVTAKPIEPSFGILSIATDPHAQRRGLGRMLLSEMERRARDAGFDRMHLTVDPSNSAAHAFYESAGWESGPSPGSLVRVLISD